MLMWCSLVSLLDAGRLRSHTALLMDWKATSGLEQVTKLIEEGKVKPVLGQVLGLEGASEAQRILETGTGAKGKLVLKVRKAVGG